MSPMLRVLLTMLLLLGAACGERQQPTVESPSPRAEHPAAQPDDAIDSQNTDLSFLIRSGVQEVPDKRPGTIRLCTYNLENLFDEVDDPTLSGRNEDIDDAIPEERREALAEAIRRIDADILCVQEVESEDALRWFVDGYLADMGYAHIASVDAGDARGIEQAVLSRFPIVRVQNWPAKLLGGVHPAKWGDADNWYAGEPITFHRSPLLVEVEVPAEATGSAPYRLSLFVVHHKSGRPGAYWREAEACGLVEIVRAYEQEHPGANIAILGDFNAQADEMSVRIYLDAGFSDVFANRSGREILTHASDRRIDLILVNDALRNEVLMDRAFVLGTNQRPAGSNWRDPPPPGYASDHQPVCVDLVPLDRGG